jgi:sugar phosphate isomerase/epimerase
MLSLAAGTVLDASPAEAIAAAAHAGFDAVGLRFERPPDAAERADIRRRLDDAGIVLLDVEVARIRAGSSAEEYAWLVDVAGELGARFLLVVSEDPDRARTAGVMEALCRRAQPYRLSIALEFMLFTAVKTLADANTVIAAVGQPNAVVLVDALHLARSGTSPTQLGSAPIGYVQLCDAPVPGPVDEPELANEARHGRLMPGLGELPLTDLIDAVADDVPMSVEVQSDELARTTSPEHRAAMAIAAAREVIAQTSATRKDGVQTP